MPNRTGCSVERQPRERTPAEITEQELRDVCHAWVAYIRSLPFRAQEALMRLVDQYGRDDVLLDGVWTMTHDQYLSDYQLVLDQFLTEEGAQWR